MPWEVLVDEEHLPDMHERGRDLSELVAHRCNNVGPVVIEQEG